MCGICGFVGRADEPAILAMTRSMEHRGPDGEGVQLFPSESGSVPCAFGHRRLSIIDPTPGGRQPMATEDGRYWITYNGELYNYRELRRELQAGGASFRTESDTEVLLSMYRYHGADMLSKLNGIFAFGIWDSHAHSLFLARDRLGVKPLYWAESDGVLYFASEAKAILTALPARLRADKVADYLTFLWVPEPDTLFEGIFKLPPGHYARFENGQMSSSQYWDMEFAVEERSATQWAQTVRTSVEEAVQRQMVSDVPLGAFLSGGVDSSAIVASMASTGRVATYTVGFSEEDLSHEIVPDDVRYSRVIAEKFDIEYHEETLHPQVAELLPKLIWHADEPIADPACLSAYLICRAARERLTVILSGMGGDEVFAGYPRYLAMRLGQIADVLPRRALTLLREELGGRLTLGRPGRMRGPRRNLMKLLRGIDATPMERYLIYSSYYTNAEMGRLLSEDLAPSATGVFDGHRAHAERVRGEHWLNQLLYLDLKTFLPCLNLAYTDKMSMAASTEVRVPLLDDELVALTGRIPPELKLHRMKRKYVFKRSMEGVLPRDVIWRPKAGFGAPVRSWLVGELRDMVGDLLSRETVRARGLFEPAEVQRLITANTAGTEDNALRLWALLTLEIWQRTFIDAAG